MIQFDIAAGRSVQVPDMFELAKSENPSLTDEAFMQHLVRTFDSYYASKRARISPAESFKEILFRNWVYTALMINVVYNYLIEGSGQLLTFYKSRDVSTDQTARALSSLRAGAYSQSTAPWGLHNPQGIQDAWNSYAQDPWATFFNLSFNVSFKDGYLLPLVASNFRDQFTPSTYTRNEAHNLSGGLSHVFTEHFQIAFALFEQSTEIKPE